MINFKEKIYEISNEIVYKQRSNIGDCSDVEYIVYVNKHPYIIKGISAKIFLALISPIEYSIENCMLCIDGLNNYNFEVVTKAVSSLIKKCWATPLNLKKQKKISKSPALVSLNMEDKYFLLNLAYRTIDEISEKVYKYLKKEDFSSLSSNEIEHLLGRKYIGYDCHKELEQLIINEDYINIYIIFSYECNMRCIYCFETTEVRFYKKNELNIDKLLEMIKEISFNKHTIITLYGGEPLLDSNKDKINKIINWSKEKDNIFFRIITNGTNVKNFMQSFLSIKNKILEFIITIDGPESIHNKRRFLVNGQGSFNEILKSIKLISDNEIQVNIRVNLDKYNIDYQYDFLKYLVNMNLNPYYINLIYYRVENKNDLDFDTLSYDKCLQLYEKLSEIKGIIIRFGDPILSFAVDMLRSEDPYPYIKSNYCNVEHTYVIDCDYQVYCCNESMGLPQFSRAPNNKTPDICSLRESCKGCNLYYVCYGGCYLKRYKYMEKNGKELCEKKEVLSVIKKICKLIQKP